MKEIDEVRKTFEDYKKEMNVYVESWRKEVGFWKDSHAGLQKTLDERDAEIETLLDRLRVEKDVRKSRIRELEEEVKKLKEFPQKLRELAKALAPDGGEKGQLSNCVVGGQLWDGEKFVPESKPVCWKCDNTGVVPDYETKDPISGCVIGGKVKPCDCSEGGEG